MLKWLLVDRLQAQSSSKIMKTKSNSPATGQAKRFNSSINAERTMQSAQNLVTAMRRKTNYALLGMALLVVRLLGLELTLKRWVVLY